MSRDENRPRMPEGVRRAFRLPWRGKAQTGRDVDDEVSLHLEMRVADLCGAGLAPEDARAEALRRFGDSDALRKYCQTLDASYARRAQVRDWLQGWTQDVRFAIRQLRRTPAFTSIALFTLALGIGANTAIFSVVQHVLLAPLPYRGGDRIVQLLQASAGGQMQVSPTPALLGAWQARAHSLEQIVGSTSGEATLSDGSTPEVLASASIAADMLPFLGMRPVLGRNFTPHDTMVGAAPVALLGYGVWQRRYGGSGDVLGKLISLNSKPFVVIGVMPRGLRLPFEPGEPGIWMPLQPATPGERIGAIGRLRSGNSARDATRGLSAIAATAANGPRAARLLNSAVAVTRRDRIGDEYRRTLMMLFGAVSLVLLIACANVANLLLVRAGTRQREFAVRSALGAGRGRIVRQMLTESMLLALAGCAAGLLLAWRGLQLIIVLSPGELGDLAGVRLQPTVLAWCLGISVVTGLIFGLAPALLATEHTIGESLKSAARSASGSVRGRRTRGALVIGEIALSVMLLVGAGLLMRSFRALERVDPGFNPRGLLGVSFEMPIEHFSSPSYRESAIAQVVARAQRVPGVQSATVAADLPPDGGFVLGDLEIGGRTIPTSDRVSLLGYNMAGKDYFRVIGIPLREGRILTQVSVPTSSSDSAAAHAGPHEIMINQRFAKRFWPSGGAVGARMRLGDKGDWNTIVGVVGDVQSPGELSPLPSLRMYVPFNTSMSHAELIVRTSGPSASIVPALTAAIMGADPFIRVHRAQTAESLLAASVVQPRFAMTLVGMFALLALILAIVGLYGVITYSVSQRTREIGVRIALGANPRQVITLILAQGLSLAAIGIVIGIAGAAAVTRVIRSLLFGVSSTDPATFIVAGALIALVSTLACYIPARRAALINPVDALQTD
ncbi:MAG: ABC transporter permease [Gemmatimonadaceae bacterium]